MNPSMTRKGALGLFLGYLALKDSLSTTAVTRVSLPTFAQLLKSAKLDGFIYFLRTYVNFIPQTLGACFAISMIKSLLRSIPPDAFGKLYIILKLVSKLQYSSQSAKASHKGTGLALAMSTKYSFIAFSFAIKSPA